MSAPASSAEFSPAPSPATSDLYDEHGEQLRICQIPFRRYGGRRAFHGPVRTVRCHEDNALLRSLLSEPGDGAVLVVDGGGSLHTALIGDVNAQRGVDNGWAGIVIHGAVRDGQRLGDLDFGVLALGSNPRSSGKTGAGAADVDLTVGGIDVRPGDHIYCDDDGVVVLAGPGAPSTPEAG